MYLIKYNKLCMLVLLASVIIFLGALIVTNYTKDSLITYEKRLSLCTIKQIGEEIQFTNENWFLEIPKIGLKANINYGTTEEVMNEFIGHFDNTEVWTGNIGLAAHNRGYPVNYFGRLKELQIGDEIKYTTIYGTKNYEVIVSTIIIDTDWSYLQETKENTLTLITCVENEPQYRRCIQAIENKEEI